MPNYGHRATMENVARARASFGTDHCQPSSVAGPSPSVHHFLVGFVLLMTRIRAKCDVSVTLSNHCMTMTLDTQGV